MVPCCIFRCISRPMALITNIIFFLLSGSMLHIPQYQSTPDVRTYVSSITNVPDEDEKSIKESKCRCLPKEMRYVTLLPEMMNFFIIVTFFCHGQSSLLLLLLFHRFCCRSVLVVIPMFLLSLCRCLLL